MIRPTNTLWLVPHEVNATEPFSGDAIYDGTLVDDLPRCDKDEYRRTMERLRELNVSIAFGGHGDPMSRERMNDIAVKYLNSSIERTRSRNP